MKGTGEFEHAAGGFSEILGMDEDTLNIQVARGQFVCGGGGVGGGRSDVNLCVCTRRNGECGACRQA
jgi:hypothetical protein